MNNLVIALRGTHPLHLGELPKEKLLFCQELAGLIPELNVTVSYTHGERPAHDTNRLIWEFLVEPRNEWILLWNGANITPEMVAKMVSAKVGVVGALQYSEDEEPTWLATFYPDLKPVGEVLQLPELEWGAKLYHRSVFQIIEEKCPDLSYIFDQSGRTLSAFCQERIVGFGEDYRRLLSPAYYLDYLCRQSGVGIHAHMGCIVPGAVKEPYRPWEHDRNPPPVIAEDLPEAETDPRPILILIQYCDKDKTGAQILREHIQHLGAEAELIYSPGDKYPSGPNETALRILRKEYEGFKAVLMIEPDCVPVSKDWLEKLSRSWDRARSNGKLIMGSWHPINNTHPKIGHLNGNLMFCPSLGKTVNIPDVPPKKAWDTYLADVFEPHWCRTGLIKNLNRHRTASKRQLTTPECGTQTPVLIHGVRDDSSWNLARENLSK